MTTQKELNVWKRCLNALRIEAKLMEHYSKNPISSHHSPEYNPNWKNVV